MNKALEFYQYLPYRIDPEIFRLGFFSLNWYATMYLVAFFVVYFLLKKRLRLGEGKDVFFALSNSKGKEDLPKGEGRVTNSNQIKTDSSRSARNECNSGRQVESDNKLLDFLLACFFGVLIGGRLGYVFFYNFSFYLSNPLAIISPYDFASGEWTGIYGMSYHGGLIGVLLTVLWFTRKYKLNFWKLTDFIVPAFSAGYFFGRIGNFFNGELYGRVTDGWWGMYFPTDNFELLRHPSQLYEAFLEGAVLFFIFWKIRNVKILRGNFLALYLIGYSVARFVGEFFREPDLQIGFVYANLTQGQIFSLVMFICGLIVLAVKKRSVV